MTKKLTEEERKILIEYAEWYDSSLASPETLVREFEEDRPSPIEKKSPEQKSFSL